MALFIPPDFSKDLQFRDTNLVPLVVIGTANVVVESEDYSYLNLIQPYKNPEIRISTNSYSITEWLAEEGGADKAIVNFKPLLSNLPAIKESIDIEKR